MLALCKRLISNNLIRIKLNRGLSDFNNLIISDEVKSALNEDKPVVALESTIITHGMPFPQNVKCALEVEAVVRNQGGIPATVAITNGHIRVGLTADEITRLGDITISQPIKTSRRDLCYVVSTGRNGGTTVSGTLLVASKIGIPIFATGGIGGVHRGGERTFDVSADLTELGRSGVAVISSGVKSILDIPKTLEYLETQGVFVATFGGGKDFPAFYSRKSGCYAPYSVETVQDAAEIIYRNRGLDLQSGMLFAVPVPEKFALDENVVNDVIEEALKDATKRGIEGKEITPFLLGRIGEITDGKSLKTNIALIKNNAKTASLIAVELSKLKKRTPNSSFRSKKDTRKDSTPVVIGGSNLDVSVKVDVEEIKLDGRIHFGKSMMSGGGVARNICESLLKLGFRSIFMSVLGDDPQGDILKNFIPKDNLEGVKVLQGRSTGQCTIVLDRNGECKFLAGDMEIHQHLTPEMVLENEEIIKKTPLIIFDANLSLLTIETILKLAQDYNIPGEICGPNSCCSKKSELEMRKMSESLDHFVMSEIFGLSSVVDTRARKFDGLFRSLMNASKLQFHDMFQRTYGKIYLQNSDVFSNFFDKLETYYNRGASRLSDTLDAFFVILYQRMFTVINSQYQFDEKYLDCLSDHMGDVKPFGDAPRKFTLELKRSFVATRAYFMALATAASAAKKLQSVSIDRECEKDLVKMLYCGSCNGMRGLGPCSDYCTAVVGSCLRHHTAFSSDWDNFIDALDKVADRLLGPYNIELVVEPLNVKISEAIMNFQESGTEVSQKIFKMCGQPTLDRKRRETNYKDNLEDNPNYEIKRYPPLKRIHGKKKKTKFSYTNGNETPLEKLVREIKLKLSHMRQFWAHLPYQYCNSISAPLSSDQCWNGVSVGEYTGNITRPSTPLSTVVKDQIYHLQVYTDTLRKAYHGEEVELVDDSDDLLDGSGSGSGDFEIAAPDYVPRAEDIVPKVVDEAPPPSTAGPEVTRPYSGTAKMSLSKALAQFLLPIVLVWFGGAISDLL
ncbi:uncharacterized protein LOC123013422 [Tribolium madens]|uniref:uncharacterized protein LOC123013422 n=1 Tax=Tribolium madens TaxID=41895 RepID=UPI001CF75DBE|nr:uncharacterized protein LOC123013422 [Tribolium madens]